jgi:hypothetical protein
VRNSVRPGAVLVQFWGASGTGIRTAPDKSGGEIPAISMKIDPVKCLPVRSALPAVFISMPGMAQLRCLVGKYTAKLIGDSDGHTVVRQFDDAARAKTWLLGEGLADFDDQTACGELHSDGGDIVWRKSHLQAPDRAERDDRVFWNRLFARVGLGVGKKD